jgi:oligoendopeptidase F
MSTATTAIAPPPSPTWDLDSIFPGGSKSVQFKTYREGVKQQLIVLKGEMDALPQSITPQSVSAWVSVILKLQDTIEGIELIVSLSNCLASANVDDAEALSIMAEGDELYAQWKTERARLEALSLTQTDEQWKLLIGDNRITEIAYYLNHMRLVAKGKLPFEQESLALDLAVNGFHAWNRLYDKMAGDLRAEVTENGETKTVSLGQLATKMGSTDRTVRKMAFDKMVEAWSTRSEHACIAINSLAGFRLSLIKRRKWDSVLHEPLQNFRMTRETLDAMWRVIERESPRLRKYIDAKKQLLGIDKFSWWDEFAPCGSSESHWSFDDAMKFIVAHTRPFSAHMADFYEMAAAQRWVEAEDRAGKAGGGFCTGMGPFRQSRIFMTYGGAFENLLTLAHEFGHAYHSHVLKDRAFFATDYPSNLAETASIFSETLVIDAALQQSTNDDENLMLLDQKLQSALTLFCDIYTRYLFELSFYEERQKGVVAKDRLNELMVAAQKRAFCGMLDESGYHPLFWCSKLHFYISENPFYNFPYTFGYVFSGGVYDRAKQEGSSFAPRYQALLADTGSMSTEDVAKKHLGVDLTGDAFWNSAVNRALAPVDDFATLVQKKLR